MKVLKKNMKEFLLEDNLSMYARGILITIILLKDKDPKVWWAKVRVKLNMNEAEIHLLLLHKKGYIEWSQYKKVMKRRRMKEEDGGSKVQEVVDFFNELKGTSYRSESAICNNLAIRVNKYGVEKAKLVIAFKYEEWKDTKQWRYFTPKTLFRPSKFDMYLQEALLTQKGSVLVSNWKDGDEITSSNVSELKDREIYTITVADVVEGLVRKGINVSQKMTGKDVKRMIKIQGTSIEVKMKIKV